MEAILADPANRVQGFLAAGHVCSVLGTGELEQLVDRWRLPVVVTGFEPVELMAGVLACVRQLEGGEARMENAYGAVVRAEGNPAARGLLEEVFEPCDRAWRGLGVMPGGGLSLRGPYRALDAAERFRLQGRARAEATTAPAASTPAAVTDARPEAWHARAGAEPRRPAPDAEGCMGCGIAAGQAGPITPAPHSAPPAAGPRSDKDGPDSSPECSTAPEGTPPSGNRGVDPNGSRQGLGADGAAASGGPAAAGMDHRQGWVPASATEKRGPAASAIEDACIAGSILRGLATPEQCPAFGTTCTPEQPLGAPMVSSEGACAAYFLYRHRAGVHAKENG
jgi:hypothetical protein